ncbi:glycoside hydrolase family 3 N-terminal domain-containing protein [Paenibacillus validus]|uniref:glycoside hydrolase family 3 N-terminal domain-containing protein n=1 Tax=Paenibacillus validus TaxID=44253 RepID=UPI0013DF1F5D|nr:glycoside hydrolase family 3 N-terminal domain-containing protein [Paenibacillus validus]MED4599113.1 glycoside hydrolase family 3 N-terminal domain-containing protein [Paenibacillus validus]MED4605396.1 glycoside hydrolase family 3 N-terminal domain-containing protein [Paenibacillus validus]
MKKWKRKFAVNLTLSTMLFGAVFSNLAGTALAEEAVPVYKDPARPIEERVSDLIGTMTLDEKIGQMVQAERASLGTISDVKTYFIGSILSGGGSVPAGNTPAAWNTMYDNFQNQALGTRLGIPVIYGVDAVHGHNNLLNATMFPHNVGLGAANDADLVRRIGAATAAEVRATGVTWTFAPVISAVQNIRWGRTYEGFSEDPKIVAKLGAAAVEGLQGDPADSGFLQGNKIAASIKHYIGDGLTENGKDQGNITIPVPEGKTLNQAKDEYLAPYIEMYKKSIQAGARTVMITYSSINGLKTHADTYLITDVLKGRLGFTGLVVSDYNAIQQIQVDDQGNPVVGYRNQVKASVNAGVDMFMLSAKGNTTAGGGQGSGWIGFIHNLKILVGNGEVSMDRINDAVSRILRVKIEQGLLEHPLSDSVLNPESVIYSAEHAALAREAARKSLVLLKNNNQALPLKKDGSQKILVVGDKSNHIGYLNGGWTISWQGGGNTVTKGVNVLDGLKQVGGPNVTVDWHQNGADVLGYDTVIAVIGEDPYAEGQGDRNTAAALSYGTLGGASSDESIVANLKSAKAANPNLKVVIVLVSGRPLLLTDKINSHDWDAVVEAWLPGSEGGTGIADVLYGDYNFSGKLPYTWPKAFDQLQPGVTPADPTPLFPRGYGLAYPSAVLTGAAAVDAGQSFDLTFGLTGVNQSVYAQDLTFTYNPDQLEFISAHSVKDGFLLVDKSAAQGQIRILGANVGADSANLNVDLLKLNFKVKEMSQTTSSTVTLANVVVADGEGVETSIIGASHTVRIAAADKGALNALIADAQAKHDAAVEGTRAGEYRAGSKAALQAAIDKAREVADNPNSTQQQVEQATAELGTALQVFYSSVIMKQPEDLNGDDKFSIGDLGIMASYYGKSSADADWDQVKHADINNDGKIDIIDLAAVAKMIFG